MIQSTESSNAQFIHYSNDGYIRLTFAKLCALQFSKRQVIEDDDLRQELLDQNLPVSTAGYCDWLDDSTPVQVCIGWGWFSTTDNELPNLAGGGISSNVMLTSSEGHDLGSDKTEELLIVWLSARFSRADLNSGYGRGVRSRLPSVH